MDDKFIIQTANFTYSSFYKNREMYFVSQDKYIKENLEKIFIKDWN
jgi:phosphatidylserine/phosphatidylglycerophosphate/cardiolipin synthase-like enzyme